MTDDILSKSAVLSKDGVYRFVLHRQWKPGDKRAVFVMLNPSTADARDDDPTIRRCIDYAQQWGMDGLTVVNLFPLRATDPKQIPKHREEPEALKTNLGYLESECYWNRPEVVVCAWGEDGGIAQRDKLVLKTLNALGVNLTLLKRNEDGTPSHPLYLRKTLTPIAWSGK